eukprot:SAG11_NODE_4321_length_1949_cov_1.281622_3_plen_80_part_00
MPLHEVAKACTSARLYSDISDSWAQKGDGGIKEIIEFWQKNPQFAELRNKLPPGEQYYNDPDQVRAFNHELVSCLSANH